ncbi:unnamed protein product [Gongylonema pulchrum]|uniref:PHTB1_C domain-containing protein n=1 Tax=Gongylonema pulchrum TaxID=637853 RepID=A0A183D875_9BILA|nr:unnamed protein product [Gongylonema pulchrum]
MKSQAENSTEEVPSLTLNIELSGVRVLDVRLACYAAFHVDHTYASFAAIDGTQKLSSAVYVSSSPVHDLRYSLFAFSAHFGDVVSVEIKMPLNLMCRLANAQRNAHYKLTIESSETALEISQLFPGLFWCYRIV